MNRAILRLAAPAVLVSVILVGCGGGGGGLSDPGLSNVQVEVANARSADIGPDGGTITATGSNGFVYTLAIPEGAVLQTTRIAMYPIKDIKNLPSGGTVSGGVNFAPEGFELTIPATLSIQVPSTVDPRKAVPVAYTGNGDNLHLDLGTSTGQTITTPIYHFSGTALGNRTIADLLNPGLMSNTTSDFQQRLARTFWNSEESNTSPRADYILILRNWYDLVVHPKLISGGNTTNTARDVFNAEQEYTAWLDAILYAQRTLGDPAFNIQPQNSQSEPLAVAVLRRRFQLFNDLCKTNKDNPIGQADESDPVFNSVIAMLAGVIADQWHISRSANGLDKQTLLNRLCVKVVIESKSYDGEKPETFGTAKVKTGFTIAAGPTRHDFPIQIKLSGNGLINSDGPVGIVENGNLFTRDISWPEGVNPLKIDILATLFQSNRFGNIYRDIAVFDRITKNAPPPDPDGDPTPPAYLNKGFNGTVDTPVGHSSAFAVFSPGPGGVGNKITVTASDFFNSPKVLDALLTSVTDSGFGVKSLLGTATVTDQTTPGGDLRLKLDFTFTDPAVPAFFITFHGTFFAGIP